MSKLLRSKRTRYTRSQSRLLRRNDLVRLTKSELKKAGFPATTARWRAAGQIIRSARSPTLPHSAVIKKQLGMTHGAAAALRKEGRLGYGPKGEERGIPKSTLTRRRHQEQLSKEAYGRVPTHDVTYINTQGQVAHDYFWKTNLRIMHNYRVDVEHAKYTGDGSALAKYRALEIITFDGEGLSSYDNKNTRIYPETKLRKILKVEAAMSDRQRARYHADINYRHLKAAA